MKIIGKICFTVLLVIIAITISPWLLSGAGAQEAVEVATVRGNLSYGDGTWHANDFGWFYYDLDEDRGGEELQVKDIEGRTAEKGDIVYSSRTWSKQFEYKPWGSYEVVALFGQLYLASYLDSSFTDEVSSLARGELREILLDEDIEYTLTSNTTLPLAQGYSLVAAGTSEKNGVVNFVLLKNGKAVFGSVVSIGDTFVYKVNEVPVILVHLTNAMGSEEGGFASVDGIFQISDTSIARLIEGGILGNMKLDDLSEDGMDFSNGIDLNLKRDTEVFLTPTLVLTILDRPDLVYYPFGIITDYGIHEIRGPTFSKDTRIPVKLGTYDSSAQARWNAMNYSGFYFDPEDMLGDETLTLYPVQGRTVSPPSNPLLYQENNTAFQQGFQYTSLLEPKEFQFQPWGSYYVINFMGIQWFAGYDSSITGTKAEKSLLEHEYLGRVLWDAELQGKTFAGNYSLEEGYEIRIHDVGNDSIFLQLLKDGIPIESSVIKSNSTYVYEKDLGDVDDLPIIMVHVNNVFTNGTEGFATIDAVFQISDQYLVPVERGNGIGEMQIVGVFPGAILMVNDDSINLNRDSTVSIAPMMNIRVADNDTLRYYLYTQAYVVPAPGAPLINIPDNIISGTPANFTIIEQAAEISQVTVDIVDSSNRTVFSRDITDLGQGSGEFWRFDWTWNATALQLSDDNSQIMDAGEGVVLGLLHVNESSPTEQVGVYFDSSGRIGRILSNSSILYVSRSEYEKLKVTSDYDTMLANETLRRQFIKIEPGVSTIEFLDIANGRLAPGTGNNHTLQGTLFTLEPHAIAVGAKPGRYELRVRVENAVNAIQATDEFFPVKSTPTRGIYLGSIEASSGETVSIPIEIPELATERRINLTYTPSAADAVSISGSCRPSWQVDSSRGKIGILFPANCSKANLTFTARVAEGTNGAKAEKAAGAADNTININVTGWSGFEAEDILNGSITVSGTEQAAETSSTPGFAASASLFALSLALTLYLGRRR